MDEGLSISELLDGRIHARHGPIDLLITIDAPDSVRARSLSAVARSLDGLLAGLVDQLDVLRAPTRSFALVSGPTAARMIRATVTMSDLAFVTPMAAVAGSVADTVCEAAWIDGMERLIVNNGGDIAFRLSPGHDLTVALADVATGLVRGSVRIGSAGPVRGVATSGRGGRSLTLGIADSVTVFAADAATADAAATVIASAVDLPDSPRVHRRPACDLDSASDLGSRPVVVDIDQLGADDERVALDRGLAIAHRLLDRNVIVAAALRLGGTDATVGAARESLVEVAG